MSRTDRQKLLMDVPADGIHAPATLLDGNQEGTLVLLNRLLQLESVAFTLLLPLLLVKVHVLAIGGDAFKEWHNLIRIKGSVSMSVIFFLLVDRSMFWALLNGHTLPLFLLVIVLSVVVLLLSAIPGGLNFVV